MKPKKIVFQKIKIISCFLLTMLIVSCKSNGNSKETSAQVKTNSSMEKKFKWLPSESAPQHYPMSIYQGDFITDDGQYIGIPKGGTIKNGWGNFGSTWVIGEDLKPIPSKLAIIYISYTENQFYAGEFELPKDKIIDFFEMGYINNKGEKDNYDTLSVGLAPGGAVSVWIKGAGSTIEISHYQASKTEVAMKDFVPDGLQDREKYVQNRLNSLPDESKAILKKEGVPVGKWTSYREQFTWKPRFKYEEKGKLYRFLNDFYNGEFFNTYEKNPLVTEYQNFPPPKRIAFRWSDKNENKHAGKVYFDETEIWEAFRKIFADPKTTQAELVVEIDKYNSNLKISLESENDKVVIEKAQIKMYEVSR